MDCWADKMMVYGTKKIDADGAAFFKKVIKVRVTKSFSNYWIYLFFHSGKMFNFCIELVNSICYWIRNQFLRAWSYPLDYTLKDINKPLMWKSHACRLADRHKVRKLTKLRFGNYLFRKWKIDVSPFHYQLYWYTCNINTMHI
jgi:hypothetical protein